MSIHPSTFFHVSLSPANWAIYSGRILRCSQDSQESASSVSWVFPLSLRLVGHACKTLAERMGADGVDDKREMSPPDSDRPWSFPHTYKAKKKEEKVDTKPLKLLFPITFYTPWCNPAPAPEASAGADSIEGMASVPTAEAIEPRRLHTRWQQEVAVARMIIFDMLVLSWYD